MISSRLLWLLLFIVFVSVHLATPSAKAYSAGSDPGYTGAPSDATCFSCHNGGTMPGSVTLTGLPAAYKAGTTYSLTATVTSSGSVRRGFQVTAITNSFGSVGDLQTSNSDTQFKTNTFLPSRQYIGQTFSAVSNSSWTFSWTAPNPTMGTVSFYIGGVGSITNGVAGGDTNYNNSYSVIVGVAPTISTQLTNKTVLAGSNVLFVVGASGTPAPGYQWRFNGTNIASATASSYTRSNAQTNDAGSYTVVVTNIIGSITSSVATLTVRVAPSISAQPQSLTVTQGGNPTFTVTASGVPAPGYQWRFNGASIASATTSSYTRSNAQTNDAGSYTVAVTNVIGSITSSVATLTVNFAPFITTQPTNQTVSPGSNVTLAVVASGVPSPNYQWRTNGINFTSRTNSTLTVTNFQSVNEAGYDVVVTNSVGAVTSATAIVYLNSPARFTNVTRQLNVNFTALLIGAANTNYIIDGATLLTNWTPVRTSSSPSGLISFTDTNVVNGGRIYRARRQ